MRRRLSHRWNNAACRATVCVALFTLVFSTARAWPQVFVVGGATELVDLREYTGTGLNGEGSRVVRLDFQIAAPSAPTWGPAPAIPPNSTPWEVSGWNCYFGVDTLHSLSLSVNGARPTSPPAAAGTTLLGGTVFCYPFQSAAQFEFRYIGAESRNVYRINSQSMRRGYWLGGVQYTTQDSSTYTVLRSTLALLRRDLDIVAIDSRKTHGQPNLEGELPGDPNAELRNPKFAGWTYKGGLFVGNAPFYANDSSGTARIQAWTPSATLTNHLLSSIMMLPLGRPQKFGAAADYSLYAPSSSDPNIGSVSGSVTWETRWSLATSTSLAGPFTSTTPTNEFLRVLLTGDPSKLMLALNGEQDAIDGGEGYWQYFSNASYQAVFPTIWPLSNSKPRVWTVDRTLSSSSNYTGAP